MKTELIIDKLLSHEISKDRAIELIKQNQNLFRFNSSLRFHVLEVSHNTNGDGFLKLKLPYCYHKMEDRVAIGDIIDVTLSY